MVYGFLQMIDFRFIFKGDILFGINSRKNINKIISSTNSNLVCIIIDHALLPINIFKELINSISCNTIIIECDIQEPTYDKLEEKRERIKGKKIDLFIGIGGGSAIDMAKGLSVLFANHKPAINYRGFEKYDLPIPPILAIPTTAGTGSEITPNASFIDNKDKKKMGINGDAIRPKYAILDPELTLSCPKAPTISSGIDSLVHSTEAFVAKKSNQMAKIFAVNGFSIVFDNLPLLINDLNNIKLRENVMFGAFLSAISLMNSGTGPAAAMSYPLGVHFGVPHGIGGGIFLPHVVEYNINSGFIDYAELYRTNDSSDSREQKSNSFIKKIFKIWEILEVPQDLSSFGMKESDINLFVSDTMDLKGALDQNPVHFYENEIISTLKKLNIG